MFRRTTVAALAVAALAVAALAVAAPAAAPAAAFDAAREAHNLTKTSERWTREQVDPEYQYALRSRNVAALLERNGMLLSDPERRPTTMCSAHFDGCAGDPRMYDFGERHGVVWDVGFTNRFGAHVSGHVWAPFPLARRALGRLPVVAIVPGSLQPTEQMYWHAAQVLAQHGFLVLTFDVQGQGRSDASGSGAEPGRGAPPPELANWVAATVDALDFALSTRADPYVPRAPDGSPYAGGDQTEAQRKQARRVGEGRANGYNPLAAIADPARVGLVGHSLGATAVSTVAQRDPRVDSLVAWNSLAAPEGELTRPALGIVGDYGTAIAPHTSDPDPEAPNQAFRTFRERAPEVDVMQLAIRGGTHWEFAYIPNPAYAATLRGIDLVDWYTTAWLERYVKGDDSAVARLLSDRWRADAPGAAIDPRADGNLLSFHFRSRLAIRRADGTGATCDDMRAGCATLVPRAEDGVSGEWWYLEERKGQE